MRDRLQFRLRKLLTKCGLEIARSLHVGYARQFSPHWRSQIGSRKSGWPLLMATALAPCSIKYDSIRVHARKTN